MHGEKKIKIDTFDLEVRIFMLLVTGTAILFLLSLFLLKINGYWSCIVLIPGLLAWLCFWTWTIIRNKNTHGYLYEFLNSTLNNIGLKLKYIPPYDYLHKGYYKVYDKSIDMYFESLEEIVLWLTGFKQK